MDIKDGDGTFLYTISLSNDDKEVAAELSQCVVYYAVVLVSAP